MGIDEQYLAIGRETGTCQLGFGIQSGERVNLALWRDTAQVIDLVASSVLAPEEVLSPVDTSGAGDAFNSGYLAARIRGESPDAAARAGHALAGWCVMRSGAIPARDGSAPYA